MPNILTAILTSEHPYHLDKAIKCFSDAENLIIFVDTWDDSYRDYVYDTYGADYRIVSTAGRRMKGSPGFGKNFVLQWFRKETLFTHLIPIDGDDVLYPGAYKKLENIINCYPDADVYHYAWHDMVNTNRNDECSILTDTQDWYKRSYFISRRIELKPMGVPSKQENANERLLRYIFDVDRVAIETRKSAEVFYDIGIYTFEDVKRNLTFKRMIADGKLKGYSIYSRDLYCYFKEEEHRTAKRRPRIDSHMSNNPNEQDTKPFNYIDGEYWHTNQIKQRSHQALRTLEWDLEDEQKVCFWNRKIELEDELSFEWKKQWLKENYQIEIPGDDYTSMIEHLDTKDFDPFQELQNDLAVRENKHTD